MMGSYIAILETERTNFSYAPSNDYYPDFTSYPIVHSSVAVKREFKIHGWISQTSEISHSTVVLCI